MHITMITPECAPIAKMGGLGDVVFGLAKDQQSRGTQVEIILPKYDCLHYNVLENLTEEVTGLNVPWNGGSISCSVWTATVSGLPVKLIDPRSAELFFNRGKVYGCDDDIMRFAFFCKAALSYLLTTKNYPDVIHCHDWTTGLVPVMLYDMFARQGMAKTRVCYTIHNFKHQGVASVDLLHATGLNHPDNYMRPEQLLDMHKPNSLNLMKAGIVYSNYVTTVSPQHAWEAQYTDQGFGLVRYSSIITQNLKVFLTVSTMQHGIPKPTPLFRSDMMQTILKKNTKTKKHFVNALTLMTLINPLCAALAV